MFIQVIRGRVVDADGFERQSDRWRDELMPDAKGFLGSTSGITADGQFITVARFESEELARQNSDDDRQSQWWAETEKTVSDVTFADFTDVEPYKAGGSDDAGFVQVMLGKVNDVAKAKALDKRMAESGPDRPDVIGGTAAYNADGEFVMTMYFTSESEAREQEKKMNEAEPPPEMAEYGQLMAGEMTFVDLTEPVFLTK